MIRNILHNDSYFYKFVRSLLLFSFSIFLFTLVIHFSEDLNFGDSIWLAMTSASTTGYGDLYAKTDIGRIATFFFIYLVGIALLGKMVGDYINHVGEKRESIKMGNTDYKDLKNHIVIVNVPDINTNQYLKVMKKQIENSTNLKDRDVVILSHKFSGVGLPSDLDGWKYIDGSGLKKNDLVKTGITSADYVFIFGEFVESDSDTIMTLLNIKNIGTNARIISEYTDDEGKELLLSNNCHNVIRQVRAYPELIVRTADVPGSEEIFENLFDFNGQSISIVKNDNQRTWKDICLEYLESEKGIPLGYAGNDCVELNPKSATSIKPNSDIFVMV